MMKIMIFWAILAIYYVSVQCDKMEDQMRQTADMLRAVCQPKFKIPDEQVFDARVGKFAEDRNFKCYAHCVLELLGVMKKNKVNHELTIKQFNALLPESYKGAWKHAMNICQGKVTIVKNACDYALNIIKCFYENNEKYIFA